MSAFSPDVEPCRLDRARCDGERRRFSRCSSDSGAAAHRVRCPPVSRLARSDRGVLEADEDDAVDRTWLRRERDVEEGAGVLRV